MKIGHIRISVGKSYPGSRFYFEKGWYDGDYISVGFGLFVVAVEY